MVNKPIKQEDGKRESAGLAVSNIPADALNRLIAMGGPPGKLALLCAIGLMAVYLYLSVTSDRSLEMTRQGYCLVTAYMGASALCY